VGAAIEVVEVDTISEGTCTAALTAAAFPTAAVDTVALTMDIAAARQSVIDEGPLQG
jgi:hypothetical protein